MGMRARGEPVEVKSRPNNFWKVQPLWVVWGLKCSGQPMFSFGGPPKTYDVMVDNLAVTELTGLLSSDALTLTTLAVYPNPASTKIYIDGVSSIESISLLNTLGQNVAASFNGSSLDVVGLASGVYILTVVAEGKSTSQKVLIE